MGTGGDYGLIVGGAFYGVHLERDGYPQALVPPLASEMAAMSAQQRRGLADAITRVEWVVPSDAAAVAASGGRLSPPRHPDGDWNDDPRNFDSLIPRQRRADVEARLEFMTAARGQPTTVEARPLPVVPQPSFAALAAMPTATKAEHPFSGRRSPFTVTANLDTDEFTVWDARRRRSPAPFGRPYACVPLDDPDRLHELARRQLAAMGSPTPPDLPEHLRRTPAAPARKITDGMTRRPAGYPPLTPRSQPPPRRQPPAATGPLCNARLKSRPGELCTHPRPAKIGGRCQARHLRLR